MFVKTADAELFTVSFGAGPRTLLALGGWVGSWEVWAETLGPLSASWRVVAYDHRGTGATVAPVESITFAALVDDVFAVMEACGVERCVLAAESAGAAVAVAAALRHPERFDGLVLVDGLLYRDKDSGADPFVHALKANYPATLAQFVSMCVPEPESDAIRRWGLQIVSRASQDAAVRLMACMDGVDVRPDARRIAQPTLIVHGSADALVPLSAAEWLAGQLASGRLVVIPGAGHVPTVTRPRVVAQAIDEFFESMLLG